MGCWKEKAVRVMFCTCLGTFELSLPGRIFKGEETGAGVFFPHPLDMYLPDGLSVLSEHI